MNNKQLKEKMVKAKGLKLVFNLAHVPMNFNGPVKLGEC